MPADPAPHVVLVRPVDIRIDSRIKKEALTLARGGYRVTLLTAAPDDTPAQHWLGPCRVHELARTYLHLREAEKRRSERREKWPEWLRDLDDPARLAVRKDLYDRIHRLRASSDPLDRTRMLAARGQVAVDRGRVRMAQTWTRRAQGLLPRWAEGWERWDDFVDSSTALVHWQRELPDVHDFADVFAPALLDLEPDVIHVHEPRMLPTAHQVADTLRGRGQVVRVVYDSRENWPGIPESVRGTPRRHAALVAMETELAARCDRLVTVSEPIAAVLRQRFSGLPDPVVLVNYPAAAPGGPPQRTGRLRAAAGLGPDEQVLVISGGLSPVRGVDVAVAALPLLPRAHLVLVTVPHPHPYVATLLEQAQRLGVADRVHEVPPVGVDELPGYLADADIGLHPLRSGSGNHDTTLPNKIFEYAHAGLPVVAGSAREMARVVREEGLGAVFADGDPADLARAVTETLERREASSDPSRAVARIAALSWQVQENRLLDGYASMLGDAAPPHPAQLPERFPDQTLTADRVPLS